MRTKAQAERIKGYNRYLLKAIKVIKELIEEIERQERNRKVPYTAQVERRELVFDIVRRIVLMVKDLRLLVRITA